MTKATPSPKNEPFGFANWDLDTIGEFKEQLAEKLGIDKLVDDIIREGIELATDEYECHVFITSENDDLIVNIGLPLGETDSEGPWWTVPLDDVLDSAFEFVDDEKALKRLHKMLLDHAERVGKRIGSQQ